MKGKNQMKMLTSLMLCLIATGFLSCGASDQDPGDTTTWTLEIDGVEVGTIEQTAGNPASGGTWVRKDTNGDIVMQGTYYEQSQTPRTGTFETNDQSLAGQFQSADDDMKEMTWSTTTPGVNQYWKLTRQ